MNAHFCTHITRRRTGRHDWILTFITDDGEIALASGHNYSRKSVNANVELWQRAFLRKKGWLNSQAPTPIRDYSTGSWKVVMVSQNA